MSQTCLLPRIAIQRKKGEKPIFLKHEDYEFYLKAYDGIYDVLLIPCGKCENCLKKKSQALMKSHQLWCQSTLIITAT